MQDIPDYANPEYKEEQEDLDRQRLIKGAEMRLEQDRPNLFDIFYINSSISSRFPTVCSPYALFDPECIKKFLGLDYPRETTKEEIELLIPSIDRFVGSQDRYWYFCKMFLEEKCHPFEENLIKPFMEDIQSYVDMPVDELDALVQTLEKQKEVDLSEHVEFYNQVYHKLKLFLSMSWLDRFHNNLLKSVMKTMPRATLADIPDVDLSFLTKTQRKFRERIYMQEQGEDLYNHFAVKYFDKRRKIRSENAKVHLIPQLGIEGMQYWGDEEIEFKDTITLRNKNKDGTWVLPDFEASLYLGHDWNMYNRRRYNPRDLPPKTIRGYKFRIFYPELCNKSTAPRYRMAPELIKKDDPAADPNYKYTTIIFEAEHPYLPICFRIVDKKWDDYRNGGICSSFLLGVFTFQIVFKASLYFKGNVPEPALY